MARAVISKLALGAVTGGENMKSSSGWRPIDFLLNGLALAVPWGAIELLLREYGHTNVGFVVGLSLGLVCLYAVLSARYALLATTPYRRSYMCASSYGYDSCESLALGGWPIQLGAPLLSRGTDTLREKAGQPQHEYPVTTSFS